MKKVFALVLAFCLAFAFCAYGNEAALAAPASVSGSFTMGTGGEAGTYYAFGGVLASYLGQKTDLSINVVSTGGTAANIAGIDIGMYDLATVQSDVSTYAFQGTNSFAENGAITSFSVLGALYAETVQIVTCDESLTSIADLKGKNVSIGAAGSGVYFNALDCLAAYDLTEDDINSVYQSFGDSAESIKDGKIDAAFIVAGAPTTAITDLSTSKQAYLITLDDAHVDKLLAASPYYSKNVIAAGTYKGIDTDTGTCSNRR